MEVQSIKNFVLAGIIFLLTITAHSIKEHEFESAQIVLYYAPLGESKAIRGQIVIYWFVEEFTKGDILALYYIADSEFLFTYHPTDMSGYVKTGVVPMKENYSLHLTYVEHCTGYVGAWLRNNTVKKSNCLSTHPDWMYKHRDILINMTLTDLFIPGTHNSASYSEELPPTIIQRYTMTQEKSILDQLISGVRYVDLRPCIIDNIYWNCHGQYNLQLFEDIIADILEFIENTNEIIIVSFKEFPVGFNTNKDYIEFIIYVRKSLGLNIYPYSVTSIVTLNDIWRIGRRIIICYNGLYDGEKHILWSNLNHQWGNVKNIAQLEGFITKLENRVKMRALLGPVFPRLRVVTAAITLDSSMIIADAAAYYFGRGRKSLRELAIEVGPEITMWLNEEHFRTSNIVAVDFVETTGVIEIAIRSNIVRAANKF